MPKCRSGISMPKCRYFETFWPLNADILELECMFLKLKCRYFKVRGV
jgi:hypothetical protein